jgi:uncharacterized phage protein (TIGR01671 family)
MSHTQTPDLSGKGEQLTVKRVIKFRAWDGENMIYESRQKEYDDYYMLNLQGEFWPHTRTGDHDFCFDKDPINKIKHSLMQFIGLLDKNGKEIYEGDLIVSAGNVLSPYVVEWKVFHGWCLRYPSNTEAIWLADHVWKDAEVVGNHFENPELIQQP